MILIVKKVKFFFQCISNSELTLDCFHELFETDDIFKLKGKTSHPLQVDIDSVLNSGQLSSLKDEKYESYFQTIKVNELGLTSYTYNNIVQKKVDKYKNTSTAEIKKWIQEIDNVIEAIEQLNGSNNKTVTSIKNYRKYFDRSKSPDVSDWVLVSELLDIKRSLTNYLFNQKPSSQNLQEVYGISWKGLKEVPFEVSLEFMAKKYLGSQDKWYDLVVLNKLRPPYVFEPIFINVLGYNKKSITIKPNQYKFGDSIMLKKKEYVTMKVDHISSNQDVITFTEDVPFTGNFSIYYVAPNTVHESSVIKIPTENATPDAEFYTDIASTWEIKNGNFVKVAGLGFLYQIIDNILLTERGELSFHGNYGVPDLIGRVPANGNIDLEIANTIVSAIKVDPRVQKASVSSITREGTVLRIRFLVSSGNLLNEEIVINI